MLKGSGLVLRDCGTETTPAGQRFFIETDDGHYWHPVPDLKAFAVECGAIGS